jgi:hypothetical protein
LQSHNGFLERSGFSWRDGGSFEKNQTAKARSLAKTTHYQTRGKRVDQRAAVNGNVRGSGQFQVAAGEHFLAGLKSERVLQFRRFLDARGQTVPKSGS